MNATLISLHVLSWLHAHNGKTVGYTMVKLLHYNPVTVTYNLLVINSLDLNIF